MLQFNSVFLGPFCFPGSIRPGLFRGQGGIRTGVAWIRVVPRSVRFLGGGELEIQWMKEDLHTFLWSNEANAKGLLVTVVGYLKKMPGSWQLPFSKHHTTCGLSFCKDSISSAPSALAGFLRSGPTQEEALTGLRPDPARTWCHP